MTDTTAAPVEPSAPSSAPDIDAAVARHESRYSTPYAAGDEGVRQAAEGLRNRREREAEQRAVSEEFIEEINRALPEARARQQARANEQEFAEGWGRGQKLRDKESWTVKEAAEARAGKREWARQLAEQDLQDAILANREADTQRTQQPEPQPENAPQERVNEHVAAERQAHADRQFASSVQRTEAALRHNYVRLKGQTAQEFPDVVQAIRAGNGHVAIARLSPQRAARWQQLEGVHSHLENSWVGTQQAKHHFMAERSGQAAQARQAQFNRWASAEDAKVNAAVPELSGPNAREFLDAARDTLREAGLSDHEIKNALQTPWLRSAPAQLVICAAARAKLAQRGLAEAKARAKQKPAPRMMRPGTGRGYSGGANHEIAALSARLSQTGKLKDAAALLSAKRRAARSH